MVTPTYLKNKEMYHMIDNWITGGKRSDSPDLIKDIRGTVGQEDHMIYIKKQEDDMTVMVSPFHGLDLYPNDDEDVVNMIVEIPQGTQEKMEINKEIPLNPLTYDMTNGKVRKVTYKAQYSEVNGYPFHYGAFPQTWENSVTKDKRTGLYGDNDPLDCFDISSISAVSGDVKQVKVLGAIAMIDGDETDWKVIGINILDPSADRYNDILQLPYAILEQIIDFLRNYKVSSGKPQNTFSNPMIWSVDDTIELIKDMHNEWKELFEQKINDIPENKRKQIDSISLHARSITPDDLDSKSDLDADKMSGVIADAMLARVKENIITKL